MKVEWRIVSILLALFLLISIVSVAAAGTGAPLEGNLNAVDYIPGDVNGDGKIQALDLVLLERYIVDGCQTDPEGYNVTLNKSAADVDDSGEITTLDLVLISRYISDGCVTDPNGYNVVLKPSNSMVPPTTESTAEPTTESTTEPTTESTTTTSKHIIVIPTGSDGWSEWV